jgi:ADP-ribosylglycohydrolase
LSVGDALGKAFFVGRDAPPDVLVAERRLPPAPWRCTDDTVMALAIVSTLTDHGRIDQDALATQFAQRFAAETERGYGAVAYWLLHQLGQGRPWREVSREIFSGEGSLGNGAAMRVAPLGAFFADDLDRVPLEATASAEVTHSNPDGRAGAEAVAVATALRVQAAEAEASPDGAAILTGALDRTTPGPTHDGLARAVELLGAPVAEVVAELGDGRLVRASDTVPFALWCAATEPTSYEAAIWLALQGLLNPDSDRDTVLAIVGGVVGSVAAVPSAWLASRQPLEDVAPV